MHSTSSRSTLSNVPSQSSTERTEVSKPAVDYDGSSWGIPNEDPWASPPRLESSLPPFEPSLPTLERCETEYFGHEPFETFKLRVELLCRIIWRSGPPCEPVNNSLIHRIKRNFKSKSCVQNHPQRIFEITKMRGGSFNRVVGVTITDEPNSSKLPSLPFPPTPPSPPSQYIVRIPRYTDQDIAADAAHMAYALLNYPAIPIPECIVFDTSRLNPLNEPYMIQKRVPGVSAHSNEFSVVTLPHEQQCRLAYQLGQILKELFASKLDMPGVIEESVPLTPLSDDSDRWGEKEKEKKSLQTFRIAPFPIGKSKDYPYLEPDEMTKSGVQPAYSSPLMWMQTQFSRLRAAAVSRRDDVEAEYYSTFALIAAQLDAADSLGRDDGYVFTHLDLNQSPHNMHVGYDKNNNWNITGILDWDSACVVPSFMACQPPSWFWLHDDCDDERLAGATPIDDYSRELKQCFEDAVGEDWLRFAYKPGYRVARRLGTFALAARHWDDEFEREADEIISEWAEMVPFPMKTVEVPMGAEGVDDEDSEPEGLESSMAELEIEAEEGDDATEWYVEEPEENDPCFDMWGLESIQELEC